MPRAGAPLPTRVRRRLALLAMTKPDIDIAWIATRHYIPSSGRRAAHLAAA
jgi:hypothetical protein